MSAPSQGAGSGVVGVVLAGGLGRRMRPAGAAGVAGASGAPADDLATDKGLRAFRGRAMVAHAIERLGPQVSRLVLNANRNHGAYAAFGHALAPDRVPGFAGPLAGLHAGLAWAADAQPDARWVVTAPCDSPFLPPDLVDRLLAGALRAGVPIAYATDGLQPHPVFALVSTSLRADLEDALARDERKIDRWFARHGAITVAFPDADAFRNINTPEDLARWEHDDAPRTPGRGHDE